MPPPTKTPRERWIAEGLRVLADKGPDGVRIEPLAKALGVTKGGFYGSFADRDALLEAMLDTWERTVVDAVIAQVDAPGAEPRERLADLFRVADANAEWVRVDLAIREWARRDPGVAKRLARIDDRRMKYLRSLFVELGADEDDAEARALLCVGLWFGDHYFATTQSRRRRERALRRAFELIVP